MEMNNDDGYTAVWMYLMPLNWTFKICLNGKFYVLYILLKLKNIQWFLNQIKYKIVLQMTTKVLASPNIFLLCPLYPSVFAVMLLYKKQFQHLSDLQLICTSHSYQMLGFCSKLSISSGQPEMSSYSRIQKERVIFRMWYSQGGRQECKRADKTGGNCQWLWSSAWKWHINVSFNPTGQTLGSMPKPNNHWTRKVTPPLEVGKRKFLFNLQQ